MIKFHKSRLQWAKRGSEKIVWRFNNTSATLYLLVIGASLPELCRLFDFASKMATQSTFAKYLQMLMK